MLAVVFRSFRACFETARGKPLGLYAARACAAFAGRSSAAIFFQGNNFACWLTEPQRKA
jgi:hypothetical protein